MSKTDKYPNPKLGEQIGLYTVIDAVGIWHKNYRSKCYLVECRCGNRMRLPKYTLYGTNNPCCNKCKNNKSMNPEHVTIIGKYLSNIKYRSKLKDRDYDVDEIFLENLFRAQEGMCALSGVQISLRGSSTEYDFTASLDRIDSRKGYTKENVQWVHKGINRMKLDLNQQDFIELCRAVALKNDKSTKVVAVAQIEGMHRWKKCPLEEVAYLRDYHRHVFHIHAIAKVSHNDRDIEFIQLSHKIKKYLTEKYWVNTFNCCQFGDRSCEMIAEELVKEFSLYECQVTEDNEGGAIVYGI